jgi:hypothetical protein
MPSLDSGENPGKARPLASVLAELGRHPKHILFDAWNWKAAALSVLFRAPVFMIATVRHGIQTMAIAGIVESVFRILITGVDASIVQAVDSAEPEWMVAIVVLGAVPGVTVALDALVHFFARTPNLRAGITASVVLTVFATGFSWYGMRKGALLVGSGASSFRADLARMPALIGSFVLSPVLFLWSYVKPGNRKKMPETVTDEAPL